MIADFGSNIKASEKSFLAGQPDDARSDFSHNTSKFSSVYHGGSQRPANTFAHATVSHNNETQSVISVEDSVIHA
jgi:hypothetical protein